MPTVYFLTLLHTYIPGFLIKYIFVLFLLAFSFHMALAQDFQFSQQYNTRLHLNPAYAGIHADYSGTLSYRNQWPLLAGAFVTNQFGGYYRLANEKTSVGLVLATDKIGSAGISKFQVGAIYAYQSNLTEKLAFSAGMQLSYSSQNVDYSALTFGDQLIDDGSVNENSGEIQRYDPVWYVSVEAGGVLYDNKFWVSLAAYHLNQPDIGFNTHSKLPSKIILNGGYNLRLRKYYYLNKPYEWSLIPSLTYTHQGSFKKLDVGLYTNYTPFTLGILYRGLPVFTKYGFDQAIVLVTGVVLDPVKIGYSYDIPTGSFSSRTGGAHEISLSFDKVDYNKIFKKRVSGKYYKQIACPPF